MGIPYYFYVLTKNYNNILCNNFDIKPDIFCFDFNGIIHPVANKYLNDENILKSLWNKVIEYSNIYNPNDVYICVDGIAPLAKIIQQRKRRYLSYLKKNIDNENIEWDSNAITPGTDFMKKLDSYMINKIRYNSNYKINYHYYGSETNGEGEHKIINIIKNLLNDKIILIHGLDADLIILSLMTHKKNIYLMREQQDINDKLIYNYVNINNLRYAIIKDLVNKWDLDSNIYNDIFSNDSNNLIETYCVMCSLFGNDFIPHLLTINLKNNGLEELLLYTKHSIKIHDLLVINGEINHKCLTEIFNKLSVNEDKELYKLIENYINKKVYNSKNNTDYYAIKNKDKTAFEIYNDFNKWKYIYYNNKFNTNIYIDSSIIFNACENYIKGIYWTYYYYKFNIIDHEWYYPFNYPPIIKDISNHSTGNPKPIITNKGSFLNNNEQLLIVLPKSSNKIYKKIYI